MITEGLWIPVKDGDRRAIAIYQRHYSARRYRDGRKRKLFMGPGEKLALMTPRCDALISGELAKRNWTNRARRPTRPGGGWWNAPWAGCPSAGRSWCATQEGIQLPWSAPTGMCTYLVPPSMEPG